MRTQEEVKEYRRQMVQLMHLIDTNSIPDPVAFLNSLLPNNTFETMQEVYLTLGSIVSTLDFVLGITEEVEETRLEEVQG
jgi:hypothetical protein